MSHVACPTDPEWTYREPYCYYNSDPTGDGRLSFDEAEDYCHQKGGHLASIHDSGEQEFINSMVRKLDQNYCTGWATFSNRNLMKVQAPLTLK